MIPYAAWLPDFADFDLLASADVKNVIPAETGYRPVESFVSDGVPGPELPLGEYSARGSDGLVHNFYGGLTKLYKLSSDGTVWDDVSRTVGGAYTTAGDGRWTFYQFGNDIHASNNVDATQKFTLGTSTNFAALGGSSPIGQFGGVIRGFAVIARLSTGFNQLRWSAIENANDWVPSSLTLADGQEFPDGGQIMGFVGGEYGVVFQDNAIHRMSFEGPPTVFRFDKISNQLGCRLEWSIAAYENLIFFLADDGFKMLRGGAEIVPIGDEKLDRWFEATFDPASAHRVRATVDTLRRLYLICFTCVGSATGTPDLTLAYHWPTGQWTKIEGQYSALYQSLGRKSITVDNYAATTVDATPYTVDSSFWNAKQRPVLGAFDAAGNVGTFSGPFMEAMMETKDIQLAKGRKALLRGLRPLIEGTEVEPEITILSRDQLQQVHDEAGPYQINRYGFVPLRVNARYHRVRTTVPAASQWKMLRGFDDVKASKMGAR